MAHTLLLGLGGTGSRVAVKVARELEKQSIKINDGVVCCAVMDTDENDMHKLLKEVGVETAIPVVATSSAQTVGQILTELPSAESWCINNYDNFLSETTKNGASTMRMKSRLAFLNTYSSSMKIKTIEDLISQMMTAGTGDDDIRVMLVSSISGGTGAGMFLQTALWIRNVFKERGREIKLRGMLILPDVFVKTIKDVQNNDFLEDRHYANAYAAIREMNALAKIKDANGYKPKVPLKIDELFDSEDLDNPRRSKKGLFDLIFFVDYENKAGANLKAISAYEDITAQLAYIHSYSPMSDSINTKEDNIFLNSIRQGFSFGSCGTAKAVYPKEDVLEYCILRTVREMISGGWCNLDAEIRAVKIDEEARKKSGEDVTPCDPKQKYVELCENKMKTKDPFFSSMKAEAPEDKASSFLEDLEKYIETEIDILNKKVDPTKPNRAVLSKLDPLGEKLDTVTTTVAQTVGGQNFPEYTAPAIVMESEDEEEEDGDDADSFSVDDLQTAATENVKVFSNAIKRFNETERNVIFTRVVNEVFPRIMSELDIHNEKSVYGMLTYKNENNARSFVHPVAMRYLLYKLQEEIEIVKAQQEEGLRTVIEALDKLEDIIDYPGTKNRKETIIGYFKKYPHVWEGSKSDFKKHFIQKYRDYVRAQYVCGKEYEARSVYVLVLQELNARVNKLVENLEGFFKKLPEIIEDCDERMKKNLGKTLQTTNVTYVCASEEAKDQVYRSLDISFDGSDRTTNRIIIDAVYGTYCAEAIEGHPSNEKYVDFDIKQAFKNGVESFYTEKIMKTKSAEIDMDIYTALKTEMKGKGEKHYDQAMRTLIATVEHNAAPCLKYEDNRQEQITYTFWGFHPSLSKSCSDIGACIGGNAESQTNESFLKNEIICFSTVYNVDVRHFLKFSEDKNSDYYTEYCEIVSKLDETDPRTLMQTPHLDKTWHNVLPYLTDEKQEAEDRRLYRGIWYAFAYNRLRVQNGVYQILRGESDWVDMREGADFVKKAEVADLIRMLMKDGPFIRDDLKLLEKQFAAEVMDLNDYVSTKIYSYFKKQDDVNPVKLLVAYNNCSARNNAIKDGMIKAIEDILADLIAAYDKTHCSANRGAENAKMEAQSTRLCEIYDAAGKCKGKKDVFVSWFNTYNIKPNESEEEPCEAPAN